MAKITSWDPSFVGTISGNPLPQAEFIKEGLGGNTRGFFPVRVESFPSVTAKPRPTLPTVFISDGALQHFHGREKFFRKINPEANALFLQLEVGLLTFTCVSIRYFSARMHLPQDGRSSFEAILSRRGLFKKPHSQGTAGPKPRPQGRGQPKPRPQRGGGQNFGSVLSPEKVAPAVANRGPKKRSTAQTPLFCSSKWGY